MGLPENQVPATSSNEKLVYFLGLTPEPFEYAIEEGYKRRNDFVAPLYPKTAPGLITYIEMTRALREFLVSQFDWKISSERNLEKVVSPDRKHAIVVAHADFREDKARTAGKKGYMAVNAIRNNERQLSLFSDFLPDGRALADAVEDTDTLLWYFLHDLDVKRELIHYRLAVPMKMEDGIVCEWDEERTIYFESHKLAGTSVLDPIDGMDDDDTNEYDVAVTRK